LEQNVEDLQVWKRNVSNGRNFLFIEMNFSSFGNLQKIVFANKTMNVSIFRFCCLDRIKPIGPPQVIHQVGWGLVVSTQG